MKVIECPDYKADHPESFNWSMLESPRLEQVCRGLSAACSFELGLPFDKRPNVPGLRMALRHIAEIADVM